MIIIKEESKYEINGFIHLSELATLYFPNYSTNELAVRNLRHAIKKNEILLNELQKTGFTPKTIRLTPKQQEIFLEVLGPPKKTVDLSAKHETEQDQSS